MRYFQLLFGVICDCKMEIFVTQLALAIDKYGFFSYHLLHIIHIIFI